MGLLINSRGQYLNQIAMTKSVDELVELLRFMRGPKGCAWDRKQTLADFTKHLPAEAAEVKAALENGDRENLKEELGDLLYNILFISELAREEGSFTLDDVAEGVREKIVRRHPHVFGGEKITDPDEIVRRWREIKRQEKSGRPKKMRLNGFGRLISFAASRSR
jgi:uncharacterized protein YabN with tetrapyrrole methylase and pyrophosphatase domain